MAVSYQPPRVTVSEVVSPQFNPALLDPNSICIVGPAQGYQTYSEVFLLDDNHPVTLGATYPDLTTLSVVDTTNLASTPYQASTALTQLDYNLDSSLIGTTGQVSIARAMQTHIADSETVVIYFENSASPAQADGKTQAVELDGTTIEAIPAVAAGTQAASIKVSKRGLAPAGDYTLAGNGGGSPTIKWNNTATVLGQFQTLYLDYTVSATSFVDVPVQLNALTTVALPANANVTNVKTAAGAPTTLTSTKYTKGTTTDADYIIEGSGATTTISRSAGTTTIGVTNDKATVRVTYNATPAEYWLPTRCFSQSDVETKYGAAWDSDGSILNPISVATALAFSNGVNSVVVQALFTAGNPRTQPAGTVTDWENTLANLRDLEDINCIVPIISAGGLATSDSQNLAILTACEAHLNYMAVNQQGFIQMLAGEDSSTGTMAATSTLRTHAQSLAGLNPAEAVNLISPASFNITNPVTGLPFTIGGQYAAACVAGMYGRYNVQIPFTRKQINAIVGINDIRTEADKNLDAQSGLLVIESKRGVIQVRHAISVSQASVAAQEMNVVRAKYWMITNLIANLDQLIGSYVVTDNTSFLIQLSVDDVLAQLVGQGAIVSFNNIQVRQAPSNPTGYQVQFSYLPAYALNYIDVSFSIDSSTGVTLTTAALPTQGQVLA